MIARADTYKQEELISLPQMAVAANSLSFFDGFKLFDGSGADENFKNDKVLTAQRCYLSG